MVAEHFVGRHDAVRRLADVLAGRDRAKGKLTVQSVEGPGGIGKTCLFDHVLATTDLADRNYLTLRIGGNDLSARSVVRAVARMVDSAEAEAIQRRPPGYYFPSVDRTTKVIDTIYRKAIAEFQKRHPDDDDGRTALLRFLDLAVAVGKRLNDVVPITKKYVNVREVEQNKQLLQAVVPTLVSLRENTARFWEKKGLGSTALRNAVKENALRPIADELVSDLSAILRRYQSRDTFNVTHGKVKGIDRLLLIIDDYEVL